MDKPVDSEMDMDEIELSLRRFASKDKNSELSKLLDSLFTAPVGQEEDGETDDGKD